MHIHRGDLLWALCNIFTMYQCYAIGLSPIAVRSPVLLLYVLSQHSHGRIALVCTSPRLAIHLPKCCGLCGLCNGFPIDSYRILLWVSHCNKKMQKSRTNRQSTIKSLHVRQKEGSKSAKMSNDPHNI